MNCIIYTDHRRHLFYLGTNLLLLSPTLTWILFASYIICYILSILNPRVMDDQSNATHVEESRPQTQVQCFRPFIDRASNLRIYDLCLLCIKTKCLSENNYSNTIIYHWRE